MPQPKSFHGPTISKSYLSNGRVRTKKVRKKKRSVAEAVRDVIGEEQWQADFGDFLGPSSSKQKVKKRTTNLPYIEKKKRAEKEWAGCRQSIILSLVESQVELPQHCCVEMCTASATYLCHDCGNRSFYCESHVRSCHQQKLHVPELVKDGACYATMVQQEPWRPDGHLTACASEHVRQVIVVDRKGRQHDIPVVFCQCHCAAVTLIKLGLWAATPKRPVVAFEIALMEWMRVMFVECQLSLWSICQALPWLSSPQLQKKIKSAYTHLAFNSFAEYRVIKSKLWQQTFRPGTSIECPACPKTAGRKIISLDAVFGLKRWKKSGSSVCPPRHGDLFFINQQRVDSFIKTYDHGTNKTAETECSQFQANDSMRSKVKTAKVDETGVFGSVCRHEMPVKFFSLRQGEKLSNSVFLIQTILGTQNNAVELFVLYDIACKLKSHLKSRANFSQEYKRLLEKVQLAVPAFHVYAHKPDCQLRFSPRRTEGFGLTDGEQVERLWSVLRNFSHITKEMTPSNRIDALTDALIHHTQKTKQRMVPLLVHRYKKATDMKTAADKELSEALPGTPGLKEEEIRSWVGECNIYPRPPSSVTAINMTKKEEYFLKLKEFYSLEVEFQECAAVGVNKGHTELLSRNLRRLHTELSTWEDGQPRWSSTSSQYLEQMKLNDDRKRCLALHNLHNACVERWFLILMKKRYADGQAIANRLSGHINNSCKKIKKDLSKYNAMGFTSVSLPYPDHITYEEIINIKSEVWRCLGASHISSDGVPSHMRQYLVDVVHKVDRCNEEIGMIKAEMQACYLFYSDQLQYVDDEIGKEPLSYPMNAMLLSRRNDILRVLDDIYKSFGSIVHLPISPSPTEILSLPLEPALNSRSTHISGSDDNIQLYDAQQEVVDPDEELTDILNDLLGPVTDEDDDDNDEGEDGIEME